MENTFITIRMTALVLSPDEIEEVPYVKSENEGHDTEKMPGSDSGKVKSEIGF